MQQDLCTKSQQLTFALRIQIFLHTCGDIAMPDDHVCAAGVCVRKCLCAQNLQDVARSFVPTIHSDTQAYFSQASLPPWRDLSPARHARWASLPRLQARQSARPAGPGRTAAEMRRRHVCLALKAGTVRDWHLPRATIVVL